MNSKKKNSVNEPSQVYPSETTSDNETMHPILVKLLEKSMKQAEAGEVYSTEEVMRRAKERFPFLK